MDQVEAFFESEANGENFFQDDDVPNPGPRIFAISVGGRFTFLLHIDTLTISTSDPRAPVKNFVQTLNKNAYRSVDQILRQATKEASRVQEDGGETAAFDLSTVDTFDVKVKPTKTAEQTEFDRLFDIEKTKFEKTKGNKAAIERIMLDYQRLFSSKLELGWKATPRPGDLFVWDVVLTGFEKGTPLAQDMKEYKNKTGREGVDMLMTFPQDYPFKPPFIRVVRPRFMPRTGHVTIGGSICTQLLVDEGWSSVNDIESILTTIHSQITDKESGGRIDFSNMSDFTAEEAQSAFQRVAEYHRQNGW